jgi:serpin B
VPMMHQISQFQYAQADGVQVLDMPYKGAALSMVILLPSKADGLADIEKSLSEERLSGWLRARNLREVAATIPRFKLAASFSLKDALESLGMINAFGEDADFAAMTFKEGLFISAVLHQAQVDVAEKGTEAAAATVACAKPGTARRGCMRGLWSSAPTIRSSSSSATPDRARSCSSDA